TVANQATGVVAALAAAGAAAAELKVIVHGTTTATNALLERKGARTGLITTRGFRDVLELGPRARAVVAERRARPPASRRWAAGGGSAARPGVFAVWRARGAGTPTASWWC